jgi:Zn-dependent oligopeptidase
MKGCANRDFRQRVYLGQSRVAYNDNEYNNSDNIKQMTQLRYKRANLLGYSNHAEYVLEQRMAENPKRVRTFLTELLVKARPKAEQDIVELTAFAKKIDGVEELYPWDFAFYSEKLKKELFNLDDEVLKPYLSLDNALEGIFTVASKLYGLDFIPINNIETYHPEVKTYEVKEGERFIGLFYVDLHPRPGKMPGAWATSFRDQYKKDGKDIRPHGSIVCNFSRPTDTKPALLTFNELTTLFHEFGHALHGLLSECQYPSLSGTNVYWDFVELPSQVMENWCFEKECLDLFAKHYQTQEKLPFEYIEKIKESANFMEGYYTMRQLSFAFLDMAWHSIDTAAVDNIEEFEKSAMSQTDLLPRIPKTCMSTSFGHIFSGGYSAGYYSYKWAEVLDAEAFERFKEEGIFNRDVASRFRNEILSKGGTDHPMNLFKKFNGKEPTVDALLRRGGLL